MRWGVFVMLLFFTVGCGNRAKTPQVIVTQIRLTALPSATPEHIAYIPFIASPAFTPTVTAQMSAIIPTPMPVTTTTTQAVVASVTPTEDIQHPVITYTVQRGDSLYRISEAYDVTIDELANANNLSRWQTLFVGDVLIIPTPMPTPFPTATISPADTTELKRQALLALLPAPPGSVNGLRLHDYLILSEAVVEHMRQIYADGQTLGRNPNAFTRIGDSTIEPPHFFYRFDSEPYHLGEYSYLQATIDYFSGSFGHDSIGVIRGLHSSSVLDPMWTPETCDGGEHLLECEFRIHNPSVVFIRLGTNDRGTPQSTRDNFEAMVEFSIEQGVIPILGTKADRFDGAANSTNTIIRQVAADYQVPLWDFDLVASTLPDHGLAPDNVHLSIFFAHDWRQERGFTTGHGLHNLTGLIVLDEVRQLLGDS